MKGPLIPLLLELYRRSGGTDSDDAIVPRLEAMIDGAREEPDEPDDPVLVTAFEAMVKNQVLPEKAIRGFSNQAGNVLYGIETLIPEATLDDQGEWMDLWLARIGLGLYVTREAHDDEGRGCEKYGVYRRATE
jgi:hypothetical protein